MMMLKSLLSALLVSVLVAGKASASVFLPQTATTATARSQFGGICSSSSLSHEEPSNAARRELRWQLRRQQQRSLTKSTAMAIPGYGVAEQVLVGGFQNFLGIYNTVITARILLSWFPQAQGVALLQPVYAITDPYLNLFRGLIPPIFGLDLSPILAFFLLSVLGNVTAAVGAEIPANMPKQNHHSVWQQSADARRDALLQKILGKPKMRTMTSNRQVVSLNY